jgi:hypothetical protein
MATENIICDIFSTNAADHIRRLAGLFERSQFAFDESKVLF